MKINLTQSEIEQAIVANVTGTLILTPGTQISVELFSPRGSKEINAAVVLTPAGAEVEPAKAPATRKRAAAAADSQVTNDSSATVSGAVGGDGETVATSSEGETAVADNTGTETGDTAQSADATGSVESTSVEAGEKPKSLFGNLNRPKNA